MLKKIPISQVELEMFIHSVEGPWLQHGLWRTRFLIKDEKVLATVRDCGAQECWIDVSKGRDVPRQKPAAQQPSPRPAATSESKPSAPKSMADELHAAA